MDFEYVCAKKMFEKKEIKEAQIFFRNGDFFELSENEIIDINLQFYDTLIANEQMFSPVVKSGYIKCRFRSVFPKYDSSFLYNVKEYRRDRIKYLENRCLNEGGLYYIRLFDENHWDGIFGDIIAYREGSEIVLSFQENKTYGSADKDHHTVMAPNVTKRVVTKIDLDFENCDGIEIFQEEILDMQINCHKTLRCGPLSYRREVCNGFIRFKFDEKFVWRRADIYCGSKKNTLKNLTKRLCGKGEDDIDICNLYIYYQDAGYGREHEECIGIDDIRPVEVLPNGDEENIYPCFISGYAKKEKDGSILIVFGKSKGE